jgi:hypothetical protein
VSGEVRGVSGHLARFGHAGLIVEIPLLALVVRGTVVAVPLDRGLVAAAERGVTGLRVDGEGDATEHSRENEHFHFRKSPDVKNNAWDLLHCTMTGK